MKTWMVVMIAFLLLIDGSLARAQAPIRLTLEDAIARGMQTSPRLSGLDARKVAAEAALRVHDVADRPLISLQAGYTRTSHVPETIIPTPDRVISLYPDIPDNARTRIDLRWPIYTGGRTGALARGERAEADALGYDRAAAEADLKFEITRAYWAVITARATVGVLDEALLRMDAHLRDARNRLQIGLVPRTDVLSSEAQRSREQMLLIEARNLEGSALADFRRLVGLPPDAAMELDPGPARPPARPAGAPLLDEARTTRADRRALEARITRAGELRTAAQAGSLPTVSINGGYDYSRPNQLIFPRAAEWKNSWDLSVNASWSLWDGGRVKAEVAQAAANRQVLQEGLREWDRTLESEVVQRRLDLESALAAVTFAEDSVRSSTEARRVIGERYSVGTAPNVDVIDAQVTLLQAQLDRTRAVANAHVAAARLDRALGR